MSQRRHVDGLRNFIASLAWEHRYNLLRGTPIIVSPTLLSVYEKMGVRIAGFAQNAKVVKIRIIQLYSCMNI